MSRLHCRRRGDGPHGNSWAGRDDPWHADRATVHKNYVTRVMSHSSALCDYQVRHQADDEIQLRGFLKANAFAGHGVPRCSDVKNHVVRVAFAAVVSIDQDVRDHVAH